MHTETWHVRKQDRVQEFFKVWDEGLEISRSQVFEPQEEGSEPLCLLAYTSTLSPEKNSVTLEQLADITSKASAKNKGLGVGGILFYSSLDGNILQFLEGSKEVVHNLYETIAGDNRHYNCTIRFERDVKTRSFHDWKMDVVRQRIPKTHKCHRRFFTGG